MSRKRMYNGISIMLLTTLTLLLFVLSSCTPQHSTKVVKESSSGGDSWAVNMLAQHKPSQLPQDIQKAINKRKGHRGYFTYTDNGGTILIVLSGSKEGAKYSVQLVNVEPVQNQNGMDKGSAVVVVKEQLIEDETKEGSNSNYYPYAIVKFNQPIHQFKVYNTENQRFYTLD